ncbi:MAG: hypothetical protein MUQ25_11390 [Candidatus Aminicenantes bacterium]|nr:hypothetical protein [Candidatus Aminicenantes bacterium]
MNRHGIRLSPKIDEFFQIGLVDIIEEPFGEITGEIPRGRRLQRLDFGHGLEEPDRIIDNRNSSHVVLAEGIIQPDKVIRRLEGKIDQPVDLVGGKPQEIRLRLGIAPIPVGPHKCVYRVEGFEISVAENPSGLFAGGASGVFAALRKMQLQTAIDVPFSRFARAWCVFVFVHLLLPHSIKMITDFAGTCRYPEIP